MNNNKQLTINLYFKTCNELRSIKYNLRLNFSDSLLNKYYITRKLQEKLKKIIRYWSNENTLKI